MIIALPLLALVVLLALGLSIPISLGIATLLALALLDQSVAGAMPQFIFEVLDSWVLIAAVLFVLYGRLCSEMNVRARLANSLSALFGNSKPAALAAEIIASLAQPDAGGDSLLQRNDDAAATVNRLQLAGVANWVAVGFAGTLAGLRLLTPPSVMLIVTAILLELSVASLFAALVPLVAGASVLLWIMAVTIPEQGQTQANAGTGAAIEWSSLLWLAAPFVIVGSILVGLVTPGEAGAMGVFFALVVGLLQQQLTGRRLLRAAMDALQDSGIIVLVFAFSIVFSGSLRYEGESLNYLNEFAGALGNWPALMMFVVAVVLTTMLLGPLIALFVALPLAFPSLLTLGFDPTVMAVTFCSAITMGLLVPPTGPTFATLIAGTTGSVSPAVAGLSYFALVILLLLLASLFVPLWTIY